MRLISTLAITAILATTSLAIPFQCVYLDDLAKHHKETSDLLFIASETTDNKKAYQRIIKYADKNLKDYKLLNKQLNNCINDKLVEVKYGNLDRKDRLQIEENRLDKLVEAGKKANLYKNRKK